MKKTGFHSSTTQRGGVAPPRPPRPPHTHRTLCTLCTFRHFHLSTHRLRAPLCAALAAVLLAGCSDMWPRYSRPDIDLPKASQSVQIDRQWWTSFGDVKLNALVEEALLNNKDLAKAAANVAEARAAVATAESQLVPRVDGLVSGSSTRRSLSTSSVDQGSPVTSAKVGIAVNWEIDLWDRIGQMNEAALARLAASDHTRNAVSLSISSLVVDAWLQLHTIDRKLATTREASANLKAAADLEYRRWKAGVGTELAYRQAVAETSATEARIPALEIARVQSELALKRLLGRSPQGLMEGLARGSAPVLPVVPRAIDSQRLMQRPDVASAEQLLVATHADVNSTRAEFYPRLTLSALLGFVGSSSKLISGMPFFWDASAGLAAPLFDGGFTQSRVDAAEARKARAIAHYQYTVSAAFSDTLLALALLDATDTQVASFGQELTTRKRAAALAEQSYDVGRSSKFEVLAERVRVLNAQTFLIDATYYQYASRAQYFKALGGGF